MRGSEIESNRFLLSGVTLNFYDYTFPFIIFLIKNLYTHFLEKYQTVKYRKKFTLSYLYIYLHIYYFLSFFSMNV